jgi:hypothetical protein
MSLAGVWHAVLITSPFGAADLLLASCVFFCRLHLSSAWKCHSVQSQNWEIRTNGHLNPEKTLGFLFQPVPNLVMTLPVRHGKIHHAIDR